MDFIKRSSVKQFLHQKKLRTSQGIYEALDSQVALLLSKAGQRAGQNGRTTVGSQDI